MTFPCAQLLQVSLRFLCLILELPVESRTREDQKEVEAETRKLFCNLAFPHSSSKQGRTLTFLFRVTSRDYLRE